MPSLQQSIRGVVVSVSAECGVGYAVLQRLCIDGSHGAERRAERVDPMKEFCQKMNCDGQIDLPLEPQDGDNGVCQKCGAKYEVHTEMWLEPVDPYPAPPYDTIINHGIQT